MTPMTSGSTFHKKVWQYQNIFFSGTLTRWSCKKILQKPSPTSWVMPAYLLSDWTKYLLSLQSKSSTCWVFFPLANICPDYPFFFEPDVQCTIIVHCSTSEKIDLSEAAVNIFLSGEICTVIVDHVILLRSPGVVFVSIVVFFDFVIVIVIIIIVQT